MERFDLYKDIASRTKGDIYIGVVGPVRTGKSTFIKRVMDKLVLPNMDDITRKQRVIDELPQSANGKAVMTTQPKFVPDGGVRVNLEEGVSLNVRLIDCVGYIIEGLENEERKVRTPWSDQEMAFEDAAELGTRKVMRDHSTIGILVTTDGTITDFGRESYVSAEDRIALEMKEFGKPFAIIVNSKNPKGSDTLKLLASLNEKYQVPCIAKNVIEMELEDILEVLESILYEFPVRTINIAMPKWMQMLPYDNEIIANIIAKVMESCADIYKMRDFTKLGELFEDDRIMKKVNHIEVKFGDGSMCIELTPFDGVFYTILSQVCGIDIKDEFTLFSYIKNANFAEQEYSKMKDALCDVTERGYGVVIPREDEITFKEPEQCGSGTKSAIKMKASASCLHIMRVDVETEVNPIIGTGAQAQEMVRYLSEEYKDNMSGIWNTNMFGRSLSTIAKENLNAKMYNMPAEAQGKLLRTVSRIVNEGKGGILCVLL